MLEIKFNEETSNFDKTDPAEDTSVHLLGNGPDNEAKGEPTEINSHNKSIRRPSHNLCYNINTCFLFTTATLLTLLSLCLLRWPLFDLLTTERLRMSPSFPPFKLWAKPEPVVYCRVYIFTATNAEAFLNGTDKKIKVKELGPIVFREYLEHNNITFHENSTLSYTVRRYLKFEPELNEPGILNRSITVPNIVLLGMASQLAHHMFTVKVPFNLISREDKVFVNKTIYEYFWNFTTPALLTVDKYLPFMLPQDNGGTLYSVYNNYNDRVNVRIGPKFSPQEFFTIHTYGYRSTVPGFRPEIGECYADLKNASEGAIYPNRVSKDVILYYWRKTVCRPVPLYFEEELMIGSLKGYKYVTHEDWYDRLDNLTTDCYKGFKRTPLPDGLSDVSKCYNGLPVAVSAPHFSGRSGYWEDKVEGYTPNKEAHGSYAIIEPINGVPLEQTARSQSNMVLPELSGFHRDINKFSKIVVPMIWLEYHQPGLTPEITFLLVFTSNILPRIEYVIPVIFLVLGLALYFVLLKRANKNPSLGAGGYSRIRLLFRREKHQFFERK